MLISLINPPQAELREPNSYIPLGLAYIGSGLVKDGFDISDIRADNLASLRFKDVGIRSGIRSGISGISGIRYADIFCITYPSATRDGVKSVIRYIRDKYPQSIVILGGPHPTVDTNGTLQDMSPDIIIRGEAEDIIGNVLKEIGIDGNNRVGIDGNNRVGIDGNNRIGIDGNNRVGIDGNNRIGIDGKIIRDGGIVENLDSLKFPLRRIFKYDDVVNRTGIHGCEKGVRSTTILTSRGCPYECKFCCRGHPIYTRYRHRSPKNVYEELKELVLDYGIEHVRFVDDCFTLNGERVKKICNYTRELGITWVCITRADICNIELMKKMKWGGCTCIDIGVESGSPRLLEMMNKREKVEDIKRCILNAKSVGLKVKVLLQYGLPAEIEEDWNKTLELLKATRPEEYTLSRYTPLAGSEWYSMHGDVEMNQKYRLNGWFYDDDDVVRKRLINDIEMILYG